MTRYPAWLLLIGLMLLSACGTPLKDISSNDETPIQQSVSVDTASDQAVMETSEEAPESSQQPEQELVVAPATESGLEFAIHNPIAIAESGNIQLKNGEEVYLFLEMTSGQYSSLWSSIHDRSWTGTFQLSIYSSQYNRGMHDPLFILPIEVTGYNQYFDILIDDYNQDGNPDFVIAVESIASSAKSYRLYTIYEDYEISELLFENTDYEKNGLGVMATRDSIRLIQEDGCIVLYSLGYEDSIVRASYWQWNGNTFTHLKTVDAHDERRPYEEHKAIFDEKRALMYE